MAHELYRDHCTVSDAVVIVTGLSWATAEGRTKAIGRSALESSAVFRMPSENFMVVHDERLVRWSRRQKCEEWGDQVVEAKVGEPGLKLHRGARAAQEK